MNSKKFAELLAEAKLPERTVQICLRGDLVAEHEQAERELEQAQKQAADSLAGTGAGAIATRIQSLEAEMREHTYAFRLRALLRHEFRALMSGHPPRVEEDGGLVSDDAGFRVNRDTFFPALIRASVIDPELDDTDWSDLLDSRLTDYQFQELALAAWMLNAGEVDVPFSRAASKAKRATGAE